MGERELCKLEVIGSIPFASTNFAKRERFRRRRAGATVCPVGLTTRVQRWFSAEAEVSAGKRR